MSSSHPEVDLNTIDMSSPPKCFSSCAVSDSEHYSLPPSHETTLTELHIIDQRRIDAIPNELLYDIFLDVVLQGFSEAQHSGQPEDGTCAPWNIAAVCQNWNRVCHANARLWSHIVLGWHHCGDGGPSLTRTVLQLERSRNLPLYVDASFDCSCDCAQLMLKAVGRKCHRWASANFDNNHYRDCDAILAYLQPSTDAPILESLIWHVNFDDELFSCPFTNLAQLRSVKLISFGWDDPHTDFPWNHLTHLNLDSFWGNLDHLLDTVSRCVALTHLRLDLEVDAFDANNDYEITEHNPDSVVLRFLSSLDISGASQASAVLLPCLRFPDLRKLAYEQTSTPANVLSAFIDRSSCSLAELEVCDIKNKGPNLPFLEKLTELESLVIRGEYGQHPGGDDQELPGDELLGRLITAADQVLCPRLRHLQMQCVEFDPVLMMHMLDSRQASELRGGDGLQVVPLQSVTVELCKKAGSERQCGHGWIGYCRKVLEECRQKHATKSLQMHLKGDLSNYMHLNTSSSSASQRSSLPTYTETTPITFPIPDRSGINAFPDELLYEIFLDIVMDDFADAESLGFYGKRAPWNIAAVCKNWNHVCHADANLWSRIVIPWHRCTDSDGFDAASVERTLLQLERSRECPLYIDASNTCSCRCAVSMLRAVGRECHRWVSANFDNNHFSSRQVEQIEASLRPSTDTPLLKSLVWQENIDDEAFVCPFTKLNALRSVKLGWFSGGDVSDLPWNQLTHLDFDACRAWFDNLLDVLSQCITLIDLRFSLSPDDFGSDSDYEVTVDPDSIILPNLASLYLHQAARAPSVLLPRLRLPNLHKIDYEQDGLPSGILSELIERSSCSLTEIKVHVDKKELDLPSLEKLPGLESLIIQTKYSGKRRRSEDEDDDNKRPGDEILSSLIVEEGASVSCPRLRHLKLHDIEFEPLFMAQMLDSRQSPWSSDHPHVPPVLPLRSVTVSLGGPKGLARMGYYRQLLEGCRQRHATKDFKMHLEGGLRDLIGLNPPLSNLDRQR